MALNHICKLQRMKLLLILLTVILATPMAAQVTRKKMLISFHKATTYNNAGHPDKAIATLREIAELAPMYPDTYLRMAEIYDQAGNSTAYNFTIMLYFNMSSTVFMLLLLAVVIGVVAYIVVSAKLLRVY